MLLSDEPAAAQGPPEPPGPYVVDIRYGAVGIPQGAALLLPAASGATVPSRGSGLDVGGHVYAGRLGPAHLGFGAGVTRVRGKVIGTPGSEVTLRTYAPQVSFNFGTRDGWSYLSTGVGLTEIVANTLETAAPLRGSGRALTVNAGAGARWFMNGHFAVGFDLRLHRVSASDTMPSSILFSAAAGVSLR